MKEIFFQLLEDQEEVKILEMLKKDPKLANSQDEDGRSPLHWSMGLNHKRVIQELLTMDNIDVNICDEVGWTPLHTAASAGRTEAVRLLLTAKTPAKVNMRSETGSTPLHHASARGRVDIVELLLDHGADINCKDSYGRTPLTRAAGGGSVEVLETLLRRGCDASIVEGSTGNTALHVAAEAQEPAAIFALAEACPELLLQTSKEGKTPVDLMTEEQYQEIEKRVKDGRIQKPAKMHDAKDESQ